MMETKIATIVATVTTKADDITKTIANSAIISDTHNGIILDIAECKARVTQEIASATATANTTKNRIITHLATLREEIKTLVSNSIQSLRDSKDAILTKVAIFQSTLLTDTTATVTTHINTSVSEANYVDIYVLQHTVTLQRATSEIKAELQAEFLNNCKMKRSA